MDRKFLVYAPKDAAHKNKPKGIVYFFHGMSDSMEMCIDESGARGVGARAEADKYGFVLVCPQGFINSWNVPTLARSPATQAEVDDIGFVVKLNRWLRHRLNFQQNRILVSGFSNGALFAMQLACEAPDMMDALGLSGVGYDPRICGKQMPPKPLWNSIGANDMWFSRETTTATWKSYATDILGCPANYEPIQITDTGSQSCWQLSCGDGKNTQYCVYEGIGHVWPSRGNEKWPLMPIQSAWELMLEADDTPLTSFEEYREYCGARADPESCGACLGIWKENAGECKPVVKAKKIKCKRIQDPFCSKVGCRSKAGKCGGEPKFMLT